MDALIAFLRARLDEREQAAKAMAAIYPEPWDLADRGWMVRVVADGPHFPVVTVLNQEQTPGDFTGFLSDVLQHLMLNGPAAALADVESKRKVIAEFLRCGPNTAGHAGLRGAVQYLAEAYDRHHAYREEWRP